MQQYFIHLQEQEGPFTLDELKTKNIGRDTPVWFEGLPEWQRAGDVEALKQLFGAVPPPYRKTDAAQATPPPFINEETAAPAVSVASAQASMAAVNKTDHYPGARKSNWWKWAAGLALLVILVGAILIPKIQAAIARSEFQSNPASHFGVEWNGLSNKILGGISNLKLTITNRSEFDAENVRCVVTYIRKNGNIYKEEVVDSGPVLSHNHVTVDAPSSDAGMEVKVRVYSVRSTEAQVY